MSEDQRVPLLLLLLLLFFVRYSQETEERMVELDGFFGTCLTVAISKLG